MYKPRKGKCIDCQKKIKLNSPTHKRCLKCRKLKMAERAREYGRNNRDKANKRWRKWYKKNRAL